MLRIRSEQQAAFEPGALRAFEDEMLVHLSNVSPPLFKATGEDGFRSGIRLGLQRAETHGFTFRGPVRTYLELMMTFGSHFDTDPQYRWFAEALHRRRAEQMDRANMLYERVLIYRRDVACPDQDFTYSVLRGIRERAERPIDGAMETLARDLRAYASEIYPQKASFIGEEGFELLVREGVTEAQRHGIGTYRGTLLLTILMLAFGHGCPDDPFYPWIGRSLKAEKVSDPDARTQRLERKSLTWLRQVIARHEAGEQF